MLAVTEMAEKNIHFAKIAEPLLKKIDDAIHAISTDVMDRLPASAYETLQNLHSKIDDVIGEENHL